MIRLEAWFREASGEVDYERAIEQVKRDPKSNIEYAREAFQLASRMGKAREMSESVPLAYLSLANEEYENPLYLPWVYFALEKAPNSATFQWAREDLKPVVREKVLPHMVFTSELRLYANSQDLVSTGDPLPLVVSQKYGAVTWNIAAGDEVHPIHGTVESRLDLLQFSTFLEEHGFTDSNENSFYAWGPSLSLFNHLWDHYRIDMQVLRMFVPTFGYSSPQVGLSIVETWAGWK